MVRIRKGKLSDLKELMTFLNTTPELRSGKEKETYKEFFVKSYLKDTKMNLFLIAEDKGKMIGFLMAELWKGKKNSFISDIFVIPEYRKQRVASKLMNEHQKTCKKLGIVSIIGLVLTNNKKMQKYMKKRGFRKGLKFYFYQKDL